MIQLTRINHRPLVLNSDLIEHIEMTPDTVISMTTGQKFMVLETAAEIIEQVVTFRRCICEGLPSCPSGLSLGASRPIPATPDREMDAGGDLD